MIKKFFIFLLVIGFGLIIYLYGKEKDLSVLLPQPSDYAKLDKKSSLDPKNYYMDSQFNRMFKDSSVWNNYDTSTINKIYKTKDLDYINISL